jgi:hypothetical protein
MQEFLKMTCVVGIMFGGAVAGVTLLDDKPNATVWNLRAVSAVVTLVGLIGFFALHFRRDRVPDFLRNYSRGCFDRSGLCFSFEPTVRNNCCYLRVLFQNRFEHPCRAQIALRPAKVFGTFASADFPASALDFDCPAAGFGLAMLPLPIPKKSQGKRQTFQGGATVEYPVGKGRMLRFGSSRVLTVRSNADFSNPFYGRLTILATLTGSMLISRPARVTFLLPKDVAEFAPDNSAVSRTVLWELADRPELSSEAALALEDRS